MNFDLETMKIAALTVVALIVVKMAVLLIITGGAVGRILEAWKVAWTVLLGKSVSPSTPPAPREDPAMRLRLLGILQREARLVDFLMENLKGVDDSQIAAAVRDLQPKAQAALKKYIDVVPLVALADGSDLEVPVGHHPSHFKVVGNVPPNPPYKGQLRHPGWKASKLDLPPLARGEDGMILEPTEVEVP